MNDSLVASDGLWERVRAQLQQLQTQETSQAASSALAAKLAQRALAYRERIQSTLPSGPTLPVILFSNQRIRFGLPLDSVLEIQALESFSPVPRGPEFLYGVIHFRGVILSLLNLPRLFGTIEVGLADVHFYIVAQAAGRRVAIAAGDVEDLKLIPIQEIKAAPEWNDRVPQHWVRGVHGENCLILQLDAILGDAVMTEWNGAGSALPAL